MLRRWGPLDRYFEHRRLRYQMELDIAALRQRRDLARWWRQRIREAVACPDNAFIPRVDDAGKLDGDYQVMHNGLRIARGSYDGLPIERMLVLNRGVHEPQEERLFAEVLPHIAPGGTMIELGASWGFYSAWFASTVAGARNYLVEPSPQNLNLGRLNFLINGLHGTFLCGYAGARSRRNPFDCGTYSVDDLMAGWGMGHLHMLHSDIQGAELAMLDGAGDALRGGKVDFVFISTHSEELHAGCAARLRDLGYTIMGDVPPRDSYSVDGLVAAKRRGISGPDEGYPLSLKTRDGLGGSKAVSAKGTR